ncbi:MAG: BsaWI family type II restriction enzyme [Thermofilaceae archaeon]
MPRGRGFKCKGRVLATLREEYRGIVDSEYGGDYAKALGEFEPISEERLRKVLDDFYHAARSRDQAWRNCKGALYEYAVCWAAKQIVEKTPGLRGLLVISKDELTNCHQKQVALRNWSDVYPDVDMLVVNRCGTVKAIASCKTSVRERLAQTAFWKRELSRNEGTKTVKVLFFTIDADGELKTDGNRYIIHHVLDCTFVTDDARYEELIRYFKGKFGEKEDFETLLAKIKKLSDLGGFLALLSK